MKVLVTTQPAFGHLAPLAPLARALHRLGHEVRLASSASFTPELDGIGVGTMTAGVDWIEAKPELAFPDIMDHRGLAGKRFMLGEIFCHRTARAFADDLLASDWQPDVVVREPWEFGGAVAARRWAVPSMVHGIGALSNTLEVLDVGREHLAALAERFGIRGSDWAVGDGYIDPCPPVLAGTDDPSAQFSRVWPIQPSSFQIGGSDEQVDGHHGRRPRICVGMGTVMNRRPGLWRSLAEGLATLDADVVMTTGPGNPPSQFGPWPANVTAHEYLDLSALLPTCDAVVCHAGWSTTMAALWHGLPLVLVPLGSDGPLTVSRAVAAGCAVAVDPSRIEQDVAAAVRTALGPAVRERARQVSASLRAMPSAGEVAVLVTDLTAG